MQPCHSEERSDEESAIRLRRRCYRVEHKREGHEFHRLRKKLGPWRFGKGTSSTRAAMPLKMGPRFSA
jgi:hypothetical protein